MGLKRVKYQVCLNGLLAVLAVALAAVLRIVYLEGFGPRAAFVTFYPTVMMVALLGGLLPGLVASVLSALLVAYYLMEPFGGIFIGHPADQASLVIYFMSCIMFSCMSESRIRADRRRKASETNYRVLVEWAPDAVVVQRDGQFLYANCPALGLYGAGTPEQLKAMNFFHLIHPEDQMAVEMHLMQIQDGVRSFAHQFRVVRADTTVVTVEGTGILIDYGEVSAYLVILRDISDRIRLEQDRLRALEELRQKEQLMFAQGRFAAMGEIITYIAHQWRQPLNALALIIQELRAVFTLGGFNQKFLESSVDKALQTISHMSQTVDEFLNFSKPDQQKVRFQASEVVHRTVSMVEATFQRLGLEIRESLDRDVFIEGYPNQFSQVVLNILNNAKDALLESGDQAPVVALRLFREHQKAVLTITDNAGGVPEAILDRVFEAYFTTKDQDRGTGIGLFLSKTIIEKNMGGSLTVRNVEGGAEFRIELCEDAKVQQ